MDVRISAVISLLVRPNQTFQEITENHNDYFASAIAILAVSSFFFISYTTDEPESSLSVNELGYVLDVKYQVVSFGSSILLNLLSIGIVFYLGTKFGGSSSFRKVFSAMAYTLVPVLIVGVILHTFLVFPPLLESITGMNKENPEFAGLFWTLYFTFIPFAIWSFILSIKAIKIVNNFGTAKSFGILVLSAVAVYLVGGAILLSV